MSKRAGVLIAGLLVLCASVIPAWAQDKEPSMSCEVVEIEATKADKPSIDADLKHLEKKLKKGPFASFNKFTKLARETRKLVLLKKERFDTPKGAVEVIIRDIGQATKKKRARLSLGITLETEKGTQYLDAKQSVDAGDFLMFARQVSETQTIVTAVGCK